MLRYTNIYFRSEGSVQVEQVVLLSAVALVFASASLLLGPILLAYHQGIEQVLSLPVP